MLDFDNPTKFPRSCSYKAHSEHVINVMWCAEDKYLYTVGGEDRTMCKWKVTDLADDVTDI